MKYHNQQKIRDNLEGFLKDLDNHALAIMLVNEIFKDNKKFLNLNASKIIVSVYYLVIPLMFLALVFLFEKTNIIIFASFNHFLDLILNMILRLLLPHHINLPQ
jgi:hypothetical protein